MAENNWGAMKESTIVKVVAILSLTILEAINLVFYKVDGNILMTITAIIGGIAGYEVGRSRVQTSD